MKAMGNSGGGGGHDAGAGNGARTGDGLRTGAGYHADAGAHAAMDDRSAGGDRAVAGQRAANGQRSRRRVRLGYAVPFVLLLAAALFLSSQPYPAQTLAPWLSSDAVSEQLARWLDGVRFAWNGQEMSVQNIGAHNLAEFILRKSAHLFIYGALSFTLLLAFWMLLPWRKGMSVGLAVLLVTVLAFFDEYNQQFREGRTPSLADVGIDLTGAALGLILFWFIVLLRQIRQMREEADEDVWHDSSTGR